MESNSLTMDMITIGSLGIDAQLMTRFYELDDLTPAQKRVFLADVLSDALEELLIKNPGLMNAYAGRS